MKLLQIQKKNQLTLPADIRKTLQLKEHDLLSVEVEGNIILTPQYENKLKTNLSA